MRAGQILLCNINSSRGGSPFDKRELRALANWRGSLERERPGDAGTGVLHLCASAGPREGRLGRDACPDVPVEVLDARGARCLRYEPLLEHRPTRFFMDATRRLT